MQPFNVLEVETPLFGAKLLEASAGTGKTFAIEHLFVRLLIEAPPGKEPLVLEQILAITFTKAAAREMRMRIRANLEKALQQLKEEPQWPYLRPHAGSMAAIRKLEDALLGFDRAQIFTIHGFCERSLAQFALEAKVLPEGGDENPLSQTIRPYLLDFLIQQQSLCPEQLGRVLVKKRGIAELCAALLKAPAPLQAESFAQDRIRIGQIIRSLTNRPTLEQLREEFACLQPNFKITDFKGQDFEEQLAVLAQLVANPEDEFAVRRLLFWQGSLFRFLSPDNQKLRIKGRASSELFDEWREHLLQPVESMVDAKKLFERLRFEWDKQYIKILEEKNLFSPDYLLERMKHALETPSFLQCLQNKYRAAVVDEFQDTDAVQWEIFRQIFLNNQCSFYLVGDPKQSIYRFRQADLYTYFHARNLLGADAHYSLDTNYRSTPALISALNDLFCDDHVQPWLWLPRENRTESYRAVKAGTDRTWDPQDGKKALQFFAVDAQLVLPYVAHEIVSLRPHVTGYGSFAILVKDRAAAFEVQSFLQSLALPCWTKNQAALGESLAVAAFEELFEVLYFPHDPSRFKIFMSGPFVSMPVDDSAMMTQLIEWKALLDREGLPAFFRTFFSTSSQIIKKRGSLFWRDVFQIAEELLAICSPSLEVIKRVFRQLQAADPDEDCSARRRIENDEEAIQIMTMHASKGLEFDVVFALGVAAKTPTDGEELQEIEAEKLRQLYVTLTRAKLRLYLPLIPKTRESEGAESPLELFWRRSKLGSEPQTIIENLSVKNPHIGLEAPTEIPSCIPKPPSKMKLSQPPSLDLSTIKRSVFSYSSLSHGLKQKHEKIDEDTKEILPTTSSEKTIHTLPRGPETGILLHHIFERVLSESIEVSEIIAQEVRLSIYQEWESVIQELVLKSLTVPIFDDCTLKDCVNRSVEMEFLFAESPHVLKGFVDLIFLWKDRLYFLDWKTNYLGDSDASYTEDVLKKAMDAGDYWFQASLYAESLKRTWPQTPFGGAVYLFLRGIHSPTHGCLFFQPQPISLDQRIWKE